MLTSARSHRRASAAKSERATRRSIHLVVVHAVTVPATFTMTTREDGAQSPPTGIASTGDDEEKPKSTGGATNGAKSILQDELAKQHWGFTPAKDSRFVDYGLIPPYSPFPPPGYYLQHLPPAPIDPNSVSTGEHPPPPYSPFCMPFPPSPYYSDPNGARARCSVSPSPKRWPTSSWPTSSSVHPSRSLPRPLRAETRPRKVRKTSLGKEKGHQGASRKSRLVDSNLVNSSLAPPAKRASPEEEEEEEETTTTSPVTIRVLRQPKRRVPILAMAGCQRVKFM